MLIKNSSVGGIKLFVTYKKRVMLDLNYVRNYNLLMDINILIRTFGVILFPLDRGAY